MIREDATLVKIHLKFGGSKIQYFQYDRLKRRPKGSCCAISAHSAKPLWQLLLISLIYSEFFLAKFIIASSFFIELYYVRTALHVYCKDEQKYSN